MLINVNKRQYLQLILTTTFYKDGILDTLHNSLVLPVTFDPKNNQIDALTSKELKLQNKFRHFDYY